VIPTHGSVSGRVDSDDSGLEPQRQVTAEPFIKPPAPGTGGQAFDASAQFRECHDAEEDLAFVDPGRPCGEACVGPRLRPLGDDVRLEQKAHRSDVRSGSLERRTLPSGVTAAKTCIPSMAYWISIPLEESIAHMYLKE